MKPQPPIRLGIAPALLLAVGLGLFASAVWFVGRCWWIEATFQEVSGTILEARLERSEHLRPLGRVEIRERAHVFYTYQLDGQEYEGTSLSPFSQLPIRVNGYHRSLLGDWRSGSEASIFVDSAEPRRSYARVDVDPWIATSLLMLTGTVAALGTWIWLLERRSRFQKGPVRVGFRTWFIPFGTGIGASVMLLGVRGMQWGDGPGLLIFGSAFVLLALTAALARSRTPPGVVHPMSPADLPPPTLPRHS